MADLTPAEEPVPTPTATPPQEPPVTAPPAPEPVAEAAPEPASEPASGPVPEAISVPVSEPASEPVSEVAPAPEAGEGLVAVELLEAGPDPEPSAAPARRRPGTAALMVGALLLGPVLGGALGYVVQAVQPATPLPPLKATALAYPPVPLDAKAAADAAPKPLAIDGDLRKLLLPKPDGFDEWDAYGQSDTAGWFTIGDRARSFGAGAHQFSRMLRDGFRRDALATWKKGDVKYQIELIQYDADHAATAITAGEQFTDGTQQPLPGTANGFVSTPSRQYHYAESTETYYLGTAVARRGSVVMLITVYAPSQVNADELKDIAKRQWERLA